MTVTVGEEEEKRRLAYKSTTSDQEAADLLGISMHTFRGWRQRRDLPAKGLPGKTLKPAPLTLEEIRAKLAR